MSYFDPPDRTQSVITVAVDRKPGFMTRKAKPKVVKGHTSFDNAVELLAWLRQELEAMQLDIEADARDWKQVAEALGIPARSATREQIVEACRSLGRSRRRKL